jgi:nucleotide-binding universal stress UspA family protein
LALAQLNVPHEDAPRWKTHVRYGSPRIVVEKAVRKAETDLLVLGTRGYSGAAYAFLGTVSGDLLREAKCDVLVVPPAASRK